MYVYWWHVRGLHAVKVGHAEDPRQQVSDYRREHGLGGKDVRGYRLPDGTDAAWAESQLCRALEALGLQRDVRGAGAGEDEFFALADRSFEEVHERLLTAARHIVFAEVSNQRKQQRRRESEAASAPKPEPPSRPQPDFEPEPEWQEPTAEPVHQQWRPPKHHASTWSFLPVMTHIAIFLICATLAWSLVGNLDIDDATFGLGAANLPQQKTPVVMTPAAASAAAVPHARPCALVEISDRLVHVRCPGSWASLRWNQRWVFESGYDEGDALAFFNESEVARRVFAEPPREPDVAPPPQAKVTPERPLPPPPSTAPAAPSPPPRAVQEAARPATAQPQAAREMQPAREQCSVSRPRPGFKVYLVTCPDSRAMIGRTVDSPSGWTVSESDNASEAIEFFMKSPYAR